MQQPTRPTQYTLPIIINQSENLHAIFHGLATLKELNSIWHTVLTSIEPRLIQASIVANWQYEILSIAVQNNSWHHRLLFLSPQLQKALRAFPQLQTLQRINSYIEYNPTIYQHS
jgi:hypothetical protein